MYLQYILYAFLLYLLYRLIVGFILPVYKTTRHLKKQFREMSARMNQQEGQGHMQEENLTKHKGNVNNKDFSGDYIDFEEVK
jgi:hypothetical protein